MDNRSEARWRLDGVRVVRSSELDINTAQTPGINRAAAITHARAGAEKLWAGTVVIHPKAKTGAHHHGPVESVIYVVSGRARMRWGDRLEFVAEAGPGDFIYVPPCPAPGDQRQRRDALVLRAGAQWPGAGRGQSRLAWRRTQSGNCRVDRRPASAAQPLAPSRDATIEARYGAEPDAPRGAASQRAQFRGQMLLPRKANAKIGDEGPRTRNIEGLRDRSRIENRDPADAKATDARGEPECV